MRRSIAESNGIAGGDSRRASSKAARQTLNADPAFAKAATGQNDAANARHARMSVYDRNGKLITRWGTAVVTAPGSFAAPHGLALDSRNDLYVSEVTWTFAVSRGLAPATCHTFQKFVRRASA